MTENVDRNGSAFDVVVLAVLEPEKSALFFYFFFFQVLRQASSGPQVIRQRVSAAGPSPISPEPCPGNSRHLEAQRRPRPSVNPAAPSSSPDQAARSSRPSISIQGLLEIDGVHARGCSPQVGFLPLFSSTFEAYGPARTRQHKLLPLLVLDSHDVLKGGIVVMVGGLHGWHRLWQPILSGFLVINVHVHGLCL